MTERSSSGNRSRCVCTHGSLIYTQISECIYFHTCMSQDVTICAACAPPGGGRNPVTPRFLRHFAIFSLVRPAEISLTAIFTVCITIAYTLSHLWVYLTHLQAITKGFFTEFPQPVKEAAESIVKARYYYTTPPYVCTACND